MSQTHAVANKREFGITHWVGVAHGSENVPGVTAKRFVAAVTIDGDDHAVLTLHLVNEPRTKMNVGEFFELIKDLVEMFEVHIRVHFAVDRVDAGLLDHFIGIMTLVDDLAGPCADKSLLPFVRHAHGGVARFADVAH